MVAPAAITTTVSSQRSPSGGAARPAPSQSLPMKNAAPAVPAKSSDGSLQRAETAGNAAATPYRPVTSSSPVMSSSRYNRVGNGTNAYFYNGRVIANPVYFGPAWGWNRGVVWMPQGAYWGGAFFGPFGPGAATTAEIMGSIIDGNHTYPSYTVSSGSPGATLLSNYGLRQVPCGPPGLVVIYGPNFGVICAYPNGRVAAGSYAVNTNTLTLQSQ